MRKNARVVLVHKDKLLVMFRNKYGQRYYTLIGGGIDEGENIFQAAERELMEEASIKARVKSELDLDDNPDAHYIEFEYVAGQPRLAKDSAEFKINKRGLNKYQPMWLPVKSLAKLDHPFYPDSDDFMNRLLNHIKQL